MIARRPLGATGLQVSCLSFGVSGPFGTPLMTERMVAELVEAALAGGVTLFDTAPFYGQAEQRLGRRLAHHPHAAVATKAGKVRVRGALRSALAPDEVTASLEASRRALGRDRIDLVLLHGPDPAHLTPALRDRLDALAAQGRIAAYGVTARGAEADHAIANGFGAVVQAPLGSHAAHAAQAAGVGLLAIETMRAGADARRGFSTPADLWYHVRAWRDRDERGRAAADPEAGLSSALAAPGVSSVVVTTTKPAHLARNLAAAQAAAQA